MTEFQPSLPAEVPLSDAELAFMDESPPGLFPENQNSNFGYMVRKIFSDRVQELINQLDTIYNEKFVNTSNQYLEEWERQVGLPVAPTNYTQQQRRNLVVNRLRKGPFTRAVRRAIVESFVATTFGEAAAFDTLGLALTAAGIPLYSGLSSLAGTYQIIEDIPGFSYEVRFAPGVLVDTQGLLRELQRSTPAGISISVTTGAVKTDITTTDSSGPVFESASPRAVLTVTESGGSSSEIANAGYGGSLPIPHPESTGTTFYVDDAIGLDTYDGTTSTVGGGHGPWKTISKAMSTLTAGQKAYVRAGNYGTASMGTRLTWSANGSAGNFISIEAYPGETPVLWQNLRITGTYLRWRGITVERNAYIVARAGNAFGWDATTSANYPGETGIWTDGSNIHIDKTEIRNQRWTGILIGSGTNVQITNCWIHNNGFTHDDHGIYYNGGGTNCLVANCIFERNADFGIQFYPSPSGVIITNCVFAYNGSVLDQPVSNPYPQYTGTGTRPYGNSSDGSGLIVNATTSGLKIVNCVAYKNALSGFRTLGTVGAGQVSLFSNCNSYGHPNGVGGGVNFDAQMTTLGVNLTTTDPTFTAVGDTFPGAVGVPAGPSGWTPNTGSPLLGAGLAAYTPARDYFGVLRSRPTIGPIAA